MENIRNMNVKKIHEVKDMIECTDFRSEIEKKNKEISILNEYYKSNSLEKIYAISRGISTFCSKVCNFSYIIDCIEDVFLEFENCEEKFENDGLEKLINSIKKQERRISKDLIEFFKYIKSKIKEIQKEIAFYNAVIKPQWEIPQ